MKRLVLGIVSLALVCSVGNAGSAQSTDRKSSTQACRVIRGRAVWYRGDGFFAIWHVGTEHELFPADSKSADLMCQYFDCESGGRQPALFADFTICPTEPYQEGAAQPAIVTRVEHPFVVTDWPLAKSPREYVQGFYEWYGGRYGGTNASWMDALRLTHWDLSSELAKLLEEDAAAQSHCKEIVGIDFDPFVFNQEPAEKYGVGEVERRGGRYLAKVYRIEGGERSATPNVIVEVARKADGRWYFVNFHDPEMKNDLLTILRSPGPSCAAPKP